MATTKDHDTTSKGRTVEEIARELGPDATVSICALGRRCDAGGPAEDGGHVFDIPFDRGNSACRCGVDVIMWTILHCG